MNLKDEIYIFKGSAKRKNWDKKAKKHIILKKQLDLKENKKFLMVLKGKYLQQENRDKGKDALWTKIV